MKKLKLIIALVLSLALCMGAASSVTYSVTVNGSAPQAFASGETVPFDAMKWVLNNHFNANATLDAAGNIAVSTGLSAKLSNRTPGKSETVQLSVTGEGLTGQPYTATLYYKSKQTAYNGIVGTPLEFSTGTATAGFQVMVYVTVVDATGQTHECYTSFTPPAS